MSHSSRGAGFLDSARVSRVGERVRRSRTFDGSADRFRTVTFKGSSFRRDAETSTPEARPTQSDSPPGTAASTIAAMLDIRLIREKPDFVRERLATRAGGDDARIEDVLRIDSERRKRETELQ